MSDCLTLIKALKEKGIIPETVKDSDIAAIVEKAKELKKQAKGDVSKYDEISKKFIESENKRLVAEKAQKIKDAEKIDNVRAFSENPTFKSKVEALTSKLVGSLKLIKDGFQSVDAKRIAIRETAMTMLARGLQEKGLLKTAVSGVMDHEIWKQMTSFTKGNLGRAEGVSDAAYKLALTYNNVNKYLLEVKRRSGIYINELDGYVMRQIHDGQKLHDAKFENWLPKIKNALDIERSFKGASDLEINKSLEEAFRDIVSGRPELANEVKFNGSPNQPRSWHFKDSESAFKYNQEFGRGSVYDGITASIRQSSRVAALSEILGVEFSKNFQLLKQEAIDSSTDTIKDLNNMGIGGKIKASYAGYQARHLDRLFKELRGETEIIGRGIVASSSRAMRSWTAVAKLGNTVFRSLGDIANNAGLLHAVTGRGLVNSYVTFVGNLFESIPKGEREQFGKMYRVFAEEMMLHQYSHLNVESGVPGRIAQYENKFYQYSGIAYQSQRYKMAMVKSLASNLADQSHLSFKDMNARSYMNLERFGITEAHWDVIRKATMDVESPLGVDRSYKVITPEAFEYLDDSEFKSVMSQYGIKGSVKDFKEDAAQKLQQYYATFARFGTPEANSRTRATLLRGTSGNDTGGVMLRNFAQFKNYSVSLLQTMELMARGDPSGKIDVTTPMSTAAASILLYYIGDSMYEMTSGRKPKDPSNPKVWAEMAAKSGAAGIIGDAVFGEWSKYDGGLGFITGPAISSTLKQGISAKNLFVAAMSGEEGEAQKKLGTLINTTLSNTPGYNISFIRGSLNYLLFDRINESLNPGYKKRVKKRLENTDRMFDNK